MRIILVLVSRFAVCKQAVKSENAFVFVGRQWKTEPATPKTQLHPAKGLIFYLDESAASGKRNASTEKI